VVQVSGGALARTSSVAPSIKDKSKHFGDKGSTQFSEQGCGPALFFQTVLFFSNSFEKRPSCGWTTAIASGSQNVSMEIGHNAG
jgi:hypothetical protein